MTAASLLFLNDLDRSAPLQTLLENSRREKAKAEAAAENGNCLSERTGGVTELDLQVNLHGMCICLPGRLHGLF